MALYAQNNKTLAAPSINSLKTDEQYIFESFYVACAAPSIKISYNLRKILRKTYCFVLMLDSNRNPDCISRFNVEFEPFISVWILEPCSDNFSDVDFYPSSATLTQSCFSCAKTAQKNLVVFVDINSVGINPTFSVIVGRCGWQVQV